MKRILLILLAAVMTLSLFSCAKPKEPAPALSVGFLKGPTGVGAAYLMDQNEKGACEGNYAFTLEEDPSAVTAAFIQGSLSAAAVPTNVAAVLYNKMEGNVRIVAVNTLSVLHILEAGDTVHSISDLRGRTVYATGQGANPEYVLNYILRENGLEPGTDVTVEFMDSGELATRMVSGELDLCMLPVPAATTVLMKNKDVRDALSLGDEWAKTSAGSELAQGCIVVRADLDDLDARMAAFLKDYGASIAFMSDGKNLEEAAELTVKYGIIPSAEIAKAALPDCGLTFLSGHDAVKGCMDGYLQVMFDADPASVGGKLPDEDFYYKA